MTSETFLAQWVFIPILIFVARVGDVSMDTVRIMLLSRGMRNLAPVIGFFQILIWLVAIRQIFLNLSNPVCYLAFAGGFATGTYVGMWIEEKLAIGTQVIRIITRKSADKLIHHLKHKGYGVTTVNAQGATGMVKIVFTFIKRSEIPDVVESISRFNPNAFYTIEDIRTVNRGVFH